LFLIIPIGLKMINGKSVCLNMIVRNEIAVIKRCLEPLRKIIDYWVIVDTGSIDGTQQAIRDFLQDIPGELHERVWVDFAHNRNEALNLAKNHTDYLIFIDADDLFEITNPLFESHLAEDYYMIMLHASGVIYHRILMINNNPGWVWKGVVHEYITNDNPVTGRILDGIVCKVSAHAGRRSLDGEKFLKDAELLERDLKRDPTNSRTVFYLAQVLRCAGKKKEALPYYEKRATMPSNMTEEVFWSYYLSGCIQQDLQIEPNIFINRYCQTYLYDPSRAEPLYRLAYYFNQSGNYVLAYLLGKRALGLSVPCFYVAIENAVYDHGVVFELLRSAYFLGYHDQVRSLGDQLLLNESLPQTYHEIVRHMLADVNHF
jgi:glycosyltransferase involved in cell wall biosynthesis